MAPNLNQDVLDESAAEMEQRVCEFEAAGRVSEAETLTRTAQSRREEGSRTRAEIAKKVTFRSGAA